MSAKVATWNVNSINIRIGDLSDFLVKNNPDVLAIQETRCEEIKFPFEAIKALGYSHIYVSGQKKSNGVAIISKVNIKNINIIDIGNLNQARYIEATLEINGRNITIVNTYVNNGESVTSDKMQQKMIFLDHLYALMTKYIAEGKDIIWLGDINVAIQPIDASSTFDGNKVCCSRLERAKINQFLELGFVDVYRDIHGDKISYSWWPYYLQNISKSQGMRIDYIFSNSQFIQCTGIEIHSEMRHTIRPSDHAPVMASFEII